MLRSDISAGRQVEAAQLNSSHVDAYLKFHSQRTANNVIVIFFTECKRQKRCFRYLNGTQGQNKTIRWLNYKEGNSSHARGYLYN